MCFTLRLHTSAAPPRVGLTQALGPMNSSMRTLFVIAASAVICAFSNQAHAAANIAQIPVKLRQTYSDGIATEISCAPRAPQLKGCIFSISGPSSKDTYVLATGDHRPDLYLSQYWYWPGASANDFTLAVPIVCPHDELMHLPIQQRENAECRLFMSPLDGKLVQKRVQVSANSDAPGA